MANKRSADDSLETVQLNSDSLLCSICLNELALRVVQCPNSHVFCLTCIEKAAAIHSAVRSSEESASPNQFPANLRFRSWDAEVAT